MGSLVTVVCENPAMNSIVLNTFSSFSRLLKIAPPNAVQNYKILRSIPLLEINKRNLFTHNVENYHKISENKFKVKPGFGKIIIDGNMDYVIKSANPHVSIS